MVVVEDIITIIIITEEVIEDTIIIINKSTISLLNKTILHFSIVIMEKLRWQI